MNNKYIILLSLLVLIVGLSTISATEVDNNNQDLDVASDSSSSTTAQATDTATHTDSSVDKISETSSSSSQKTSDTTSQSTTQKVTEKTNEKTQTSSDTTTKASSDSIDKTSSDTTTNTSSDSIYETNSDTTSESNTTTNSQSTQTESQSTQQSQSTSNTTKESSNTTTQITTKNDDNSINLPETISVKSLKTDPDDSSTTHIITNENYKEYFIYDGRTGYGLSDLVNDGDTLDIQGEIYLTDNVGIDKAVNIISSIGDGMFIRSDELTSDRKNITITSGGSNTNITGITLYNIGFYTSQASNITIDYLNMTNIEKDIGYGVGAVSIRDDSSNVTITNSNFYSENNGGHSIVVCAGVDGFYFINNTIQGVGRVGDLFYLTTYNTGHDFEDINAHAYVINNTIIGPEEPLDICWAISLSTTYSYFVGNYIEYSGQGIRGQWGGGVSRENYFINNTLVGTYILATNATVTGNTAEYITLNGEGTVTGNTAKNITINGEDGQTATNNTITDTFNIRTNNNIIENNTITGTDTIVNITGSENTFKNNTINEGTIIVTGSNNLIEENYIYAAEHVAINLTENTGNTVQNNYLGYTTLYSDQTIPTPIINTEGNILDNNIQECYGYNVTSYSEFQSVQVLIDQNKLSQNLINYVINFNDGDYDATGFSYNFNDVNDTFTPYVYYLTLNGNGQTVYNASYMFNLGSNNSYQSYYTIKDLNFVEENDNRNPTIYLNGAAMTFINCTFTSHTVKSTYGYGILSTYQHCGAYFYDCTFTGYYLNSTRGFINPGSTNCADIINLTNCKFINMTVPFLFNATNLTIKNSEFINISVLDDSDCLFKVNSSLILENNTFENCNSYIDLVGLEITEVIIYGNTIINSGSEGLFYNVSNPEYLEVENYIVENNTYINNTFIVNTVVNDATIGLNDFNTTLNTTNGGLLIDATGTIEVYIDGEKYDTLLLNNSYANLTIKNEDLPKLGEYTIELKYIPDSSSFQETSTIFTITTQAIDTDIIDVDVTENPKQYRDVTVNATLVNSEGVPFANQDVVVITKDGEETVITDEEGKLTYTFKPSMYGNQNITISYPGYEKYQPSTTSLTINVQEGKSEITLSLPDSEITTKVGETTNLELTLTDVYDQPVDDGYVEYYLNGVLQTILEVTDGVVNVPVTTATPGENNVTLIYPETTNYYSKYITKIINTDQLEAVITVESQNAKIGDTTILTAYVNDEFGNPINEGKVVFKINGKTIYSVTGSKYAFVDNGVATLVYITENTGKELNNITAVYNGTETYTTADTIEEGVLTIVKSNVSITFTYNNDLKPGQTLTVTAIISDETNLINGGQIAIKLNGKTVGHADVTNGIATFTYVIPADYSAKDYTITIVFGGSIYERTEVNDTLTLTKYNTQIDTASQLIINQGSNTTITATVRDLSDGNVVNRETSKVSIKVNGKTVAQTTAVNGIINETIDTSSYKNNYYTITIIYGENSQYQTSSTEVLLITQKSATSTLSITPTVDSTVATTVASTNSNTNTNSTVVSNDMLIATKN